MHTYISKWTYLCMYTKMSLELVLQGLCRFFFFFFFILYKGFYLCCGFTVSAATGRRDTLFGWKLHNSSLIFSFKHKPAINTSPAQTRTHCWDHLDNMGDTRESFLLRHEWLGSFLLVFFFPPPSVTTVMEEQHLESYTADRGINVWKCAIIKNALCALVMSHTRVVCWLLLA